MPLLIGPYNLTGTDAQNAILAPMATVMADTLALPGTWRVLATNVRVLPRDQMPWARKPGTNGPNDPGVRSRGFWDSHRFPNDILLADDLFPTPELARKTFAHEGTHQLDDQWMLRSNRKDIKPKFEPDAAGWPSEEFAVYGSAAIFGFADPPYKSYYKDYTIPLLEWPSVKDAALRDDHPVIPPPQPPPADQEVTVPVGTTLLVTAQ